MPGVAGEPTRHGKGVGPAMYSGHAWEGGQRATFNYGSGVLCIAHRLLLSLFARFALSSAHHSSPQTFSSPRQTFSDIQIAQPARDCKQNSSIYN